MIRKLSILLVAWSLLNAPARAATRPDYTRTILDQARTIVGGDQSHEEKIAALSVLFSRFLDTDAMGCQRSDHIGRDSRRCRKRNSGRSSTSCWNEPMWGHCCCSRIQISCTRASAHGKGCDNRYRDCHTARSVRCRIHTDERRQRLVC